MAENDDSVNEFDQLLGEGPFKTFNTLKLEAGNNVKRGTILAFNTASENVEPFDSGVSSGGLDVFYGIAANDVDTTSSAPKPIAIYIAGEFRIRGLIFQTSGDSADQTFVNAARALGVILKDSLAGPTLTP